nr:peptide chain release factor N(5)-glutamine methyltransferase [uncultured Capnocytophaga sp.]
MTFIEVKRYIEATLGALYPKSEIQSFYFILLEHYIGCKRAEILAFPDTFIEEDIAQPIFKAIRELHSFKPIQYILGETVFFSNRFFVDKNVLIPRPETEELVAWVIEEATHMLSKKDCIRVLDIGTGSGCIAISIAKRIPRTEVTAIDISGRALEIAKRNALLNEVDIEFLEEDILRIEKFSEKYDIIISNPPYVRELEKGEMSSNVLDYEPHLALFVSDENPLLFYRKIVSIAQKSLVSKGKLFFEINQYLGEEMRNLLTNNDFKEVVLLEDIFGNDRMIKGELY